MDRDVVIVGGGVGGSSLGAALAASGASVTLLERTTTFEDRVRGEWIAPWGVAEAKRLDLYDALIEAGGHHLARHLGYDELDVEEGKPPLALPLDAIHPESPGPLCLEHVVMQNTLLDRARAAGAEVVRDVRAVEVTPGASPRVGFHHEGRDRDLSCRLVVGADGRSSAVRRQAGIPLHEDPVDHLLAGLLVDGADDWPEDLQSTGKMGDIYYLVFPQGGGRVRLYADYDISGRGRFSGAEGARNFLSAFDMPGVPQSASLSGARPVGPCNSLPSQDAWTERPFTEGVVLIGDAAGYNDPIAGQGVSITLRDARTVRDLLAESVTWRPALFEPYAEERRERLRRLRLSARFMTHLFAKFDAEAIDRRKRARRRLDEDPGLMGLLLAPFAGPDLVPAELFTPERVEGVFAA